MQKRIENLDLVRAIAIILVIYDHTCQMLLPHLFTNNAYYYVGHHGVTLFFVLSGCLVGGMYIKNPTQNSFKFWLARFLRTYPPYIVILVLAWLAVYIVRQQPFDFGMLLFWQNFYQQIPFFLASWSLAVEEHFYLLFAVAIYCLPNKKWQIYLWTMLLLVSPLARYFTYQTNGHFGYDKTASFLHLDSLASGVLLAYYIHSKPKRQSLHPLSYYVALIATLAVALYTSSVENRYTWAFGNALLNAAIVALIAAAHYTKPLAIAKLGFIKQTALMAYSLYLVHPMVIHLATYSNSNQTAIVYILTLLAIYTCAYIFYIAIERKAINYRDRWLQHWQPKTPKLFTRNRHLSNLKSIGKQQPLT